ncbi:hypothetical protein EVAR_33509_1 [Eumeta japonica]|uniref:Uncharacterized protein n=1 Tax=Eumeta variegata TaxID=151549 RepID=A0A4C1VJR1_EUMVA|nr:hypothetical protein EVAR_33509_1 [Eumeta japonica]
MVTAGESNRLSVIVPRPVSSAAERLRGETQANPKEMDSFQEDIKKLTRGHPVDKDSRLHSLNVKMEREMEYSHHQN